MLLHNNDDEQLICLFLWRKKYRLLKQISIILSPQFCFYITWNWQSTQQNSTWYLRSIAFFREKQALKVKEGQSARKDCRYCHLIGTFRTWFSSSDPGLLKCGNLRYRINYHGILNWYVYFAIIFSGNCWKSRLKRISRSSGHAGVPKGYSQFSFFFFFFGRSNFENFLKHIRCTQYE